MTDFTPANYPPPAARAWKPKFRSIVIAIACAAVCTLLALTGQGDPGLAAANQQRG